MFGYVSIDSSSLLAEEKDRYQAHYCGLCHCLGTAYGFPGRMTLTYDMTFLSILLSAVYCDTEKTGTFRCPSGPWRKCSFVVTEMTDYAADMNLVLAYYKATDDRQDDGSISAAFKEKVLADRAERAMKKWPVQSAAIRQCLKELSFMEARNELNPDLPTNCFAALMGALFALRPEDPLAGTLYQMGCALGRFIYLMDAAMDLKADIKKERYNPLIAQMDTDFTPLLTMLIGECTEAFETLPLRQDEQILRNILYAGVWTKYKLKRKEQSHDEPL